ncbi:PLP-dependent transferase [Metschnikowia bicuspidata var. bicuspidata NRRL YB-4993]|uniref:PLP-dependent transferase n=1 Tax=Metschnikowia bicuspidata var. bicuspidata NRRL YB-4993 TaxID=869754 RepID=A0A1A0HDV5_9ASCO|nr:PLP-dependent transferase [Metschnikowia bicuspidata var. bicuspidata NRRL YB-4993]OBA22274.1 PLP-dependent transferase [Metschnikowia bicuspidata var. bicuspidata NRRL YB-4993]
MTRPINFFKGHPTLTLLPNQELADAYRRVLVEQNFSHSDNDPSNRYPLEYGTDPGNLSTRETILQWSNSRYGRKTDDPDVVNLTAGSSCGAANILLACTRSNITKHVFLVSPTYFLINYAFIDAGFEGQMSAVMETAGEEYDIDIAGLEQKLQELDRKHGLEAVSAKEINVIHDPTQRGPRKFYRYAMYLVPTFSNPGGISYSTKTRSKLLEIARKHDVLLISDDVYDLLDFGLETPKLPKINHIDQDTLPDGWVYGNSVSNSSFSKLIAPGLRTGWQETATPCLAQQLATTGSNKSGGTPAQLNICVVQNMIQTGDLDRCISRLNLAFRARAKALVSALQRHLPAKYLKIGGGQGGYFVWCTIDAEDVDVGKTLEILRDEHQVLIAEGHHFEVEGDSKGWGKKCARLCVAYLDEEEIEEGISKWGEIMQREYPGLYRE